MTKRAWRGHPPGIGGIKSHRLPVDRTCTCLGYLLFLFSDFLCRLDFPIVPCSTSVFTPRAIRTPASCNAQAEKGRTRKRKPPGTAVASLFTTSGDPPHFSAVAPAGGFTWSQPSPHHHGIAGSTHSAKRRWNSESCGIVREELRCIWDAAAGKRWLWWAPLRPRATLRSRYAGPAGRANRNPSTLRCAISIFS